jgi:hypothetical protein
MPVISNRALRRAPFLALAAVVTTFSWVPTASAAWPGRNGAIFFDVFPGCVVASCPETPPCQSGPCSPPDPVALRTRLFALDPVTRRLRPLLADLNVAFRPAISPDGRRLAVGTSEGLLFTDPSGGGREYARSYISDVAWLPDGRLAFPWTEPAPPIEPKGCPSERFGLRVRRPESASAAVIHTATRNAVAPAFSARSRMIAYDGFNKVTPVDRHLSFESCTVVHSDAVWIQRMGAPRTARRLLSFRPGRLAGLRRPFDFSPDGRRLAVLTSRGVVVVNVDGGHARTLRATRDAASVAWSPDGRWLAVSTGLVKGPGRTRLVLIPARGGPRKTIASWAVPSGVGGAGIGTITWQPLHGG